MLKLHLLSLLPMFYFHSYLCMLSHLLWPLHFDGTIIVLFYTIHMVLSPRVYMYVLCIKNSPGHTWFLLWRSNVNHIFPMSCTSEARKTWKRENTMYYSLVLGYSININPVMLEFYCSFESINWRAAISGHRCLKTYLPDPTFLSSNSQTLNS
jgi:hypothetical protein